jgi:hypothetical protein
MSKIINYCATITRMGKVVDMAPEGADPIFVRYVGNRPVAYHDGKCWRIV